MIPNIPNTPIVINVPNVPFYSQFADIDNLKWQKVGCGVTSLAMVIDYYKPNAVTVNNLLSRGIASGAYNPNAGWSHAGLIALTKKYDLNGVAYDISKLSDADAFAQFKNLLKEGPVIVSVHYKFDPKNPIPHMVVIDGMKGDKIYYNDPAIRIGQKQITVADFLKAWKKKFIVIRPNYIVKINDIKV